MNCRDISTLLQRTRWWGKAAAVGAFFALGLGANAQVTVTGATVGNGTYTTLGAAFTAINGGAQGAGDNILVDITASTSETGPAVLNTNTWATLTIRPSATATIAGSATAAAGRGVIELNGADNVTINGDIAGGSVGRDLTVTNNNPTATSNTSVVRVATGTGNLTANNITISNCVLNGSATGRNGATFTSTTGAENNTFGVVVGPNAGVPPAAPTALTSVTGAMVAAATANAFSISNCAVNQCARGIVFLGGAAANSTGITISNNTVGGSGTLSGAPPYTSPASTVYTKGIYVQGTTAATITGNTIRNILSFVGTTMNGIELNSAIGTGTIDISTNSINGVVQNSASSTSSQQALIVSSAVAGATVTINGNTITNVQNGGGSSFSARPQGLTYSGGAAGAVISNNTISQVYNRSTGTAGAYGLNVTGGNNHSIFNNCISDINQNIAGGAAFSTSFGMIGMNITGGTGHTVYHNTVNLSGAVLAGAGTSVLSSCIAVAGTGQTGLNIRNNLFSNTMSGFAATSAAVCMFLPQSATVAMNLTTNNNAYFTGSTSGLHGVAHVNTTYLGTPAGPTTYAGLYTAANFNPALTTPNNNFRAYTSILNVAGTNDNASFASTLAAPLSGCGVDVGSGQAALVNGTGATGTGVALDRDGDTRGTPPDIGADEFILLICGGADGGTITPATASACAGGTYVMSSTGSTTGAGITNQWLVSTTSGGPYSPVVGGSGATSTSYTTGPLAAGTYYFVMRNTCSTGPVSDDSNELTLTVNPVPTAAASNNGPACAGTSVNLTGTTDIGTTFSWTGPNSFTSSLQNPTVNPLVLASAGTYTFTATAAGCPSLPATTTVTVNPVIYATAATATPNPVCNGGTSTLSVSAGTTTAYAVSSTPHAPQPTTGFTNGPSGDDAISSGIPLPFTVDFFGTAYTQLFINTNGQVGFNYTGSTAAEQRNAQILPSATLPNANISLCWADLNAGVGQITYGTNGSAPNRVFVVNYNAVPFFSGGGVVTGQIQIYENDMHIEVHATSVTTNTALKTLGIENASGTVGYAGTGRNGVNWLVGTPEAWAFRPSGGALTYSWTPAPSVVNPAAASTLTNALFANTPFSVNITDGSCPVTRNVTVNITAPITAATITGTLSYCAGGSTTLTAVPTDGAGPFTYVWTGPSGPEGTAATQVADEPGLWSVVVSDNCGGTAPSVSVTVVENPLPTVAIAPTPANAAICGGVGNVALAASGASTYAWAPATGLSSTTGANVTSTATSTITYTVTGTDANGCVDTETQTVNVGANPTLGTPTATPASICEGDNSNLSVTGSVQGYVQGAGGSSFIDISATGTVVTGTPSDDSEHNVTIPSFIFNGTAYTQLRVGNNGKVVLGVTSGEVGYANSALPYALSGLGATTAGSVAIMPWWDDLTPGTGNSIRTQTVGNLFIVQWTNEDHFDAPGTGTITFQLQLDLVTGVIYFAYSDVDFTGTAAQDKGGSATVGLQFSSTSFQQSSFNTQTLTAGQVISYTPAQPTWSWSPATFLSSTTVANPTATAITTLPITYTVTASSPIGCTSTANVTITEDLTDTDGDLITDCDDNCPTLAGQIGDYCDADPGAGFLFGQISGACTCDPVPCTENVIVDLRTDANSDEASWEILLQGSAQVVCQGGGYAPNITTPITEPCCLPAGCFRLRVLDSGGDGFVTGGYQLRESGVNGRRIIDNFGNFNNGSVSAIASTYENGAFCVPIGDDKLIFSSCDKLDWVANKFIVASANPAVSAQFGVTNATSGYEFWFFDPNGTYSYRRFRSHATSDGFGTGATRACHFKVNGWINTPSTPHLPSNVLLNVRIRGRVAGNDLPFGPACRFKIDAALAACPRVKLQDDPANTSDFSCGVFRNFGGASNPNNRITAAPPQPIPTVASSNVRYQFRFRIPAENICIVRPPQTSARLVLNWTTGTPLQCSKTYEVDVRVSLDGGATWCFGPASSSEAAACADTQAWGTVCLVTINPCPSVNGGGNSMVVEGNNTFTMYPNPNRGDQLFLSVSNVEEGVNTVDVDIFDMAGKRVMARTIAVQDGFVNTNMELNGDLAGGLYVVNITAGTKSYTERLVIQP